MTLAKALHGASFCPHDGADELNSREPSHEKSWAEVLAPGDEREASRCAKRNPENPKTRQTKKDGKAETVRKKPRKAKDQKSPAAVMPDISAAMADMPIPSEETGKRKKDKRKQDFGPDKPPAGKRKHRKKKSVIEGDALYNRGRGRKKRGKKDAKAKKGKFQKGF